MKRRRILPVGILSALAVAVVAASFAWACTGPGYGTPSSPAAPSEPARPADAAPVDPAPPAAATPAPAPAAAPVPVAPAQAAPAPAPAPAAESTGPATSNSPAVSRQPSDSAPAPAPGRSTSGSAAPQPSTGPSSSVAAEQFDARLSGATEGVVAGRGEQPVFAGSVAESPAPANAEAAPANAEGAGATDAAPSPASATGNLWSGFAPEKSSSLSAAGPAAMPQDSGASSQVLGMAILGLGLTGLLGGALVAAVRRQRVQAGRGGGRNEL